MEFVEGETLEVHLQRAGTLSAAFAVEIAIQVCRALTSEEKRGLVHWDLKPSNIMLVKGVEAEPRSDHEAWVRVIDFGLAKAVSVANDSGDSAQDPAPAGWGGRTSFVGTPQFASPEQLSGKELDVRSDIWGGIKDVRALFRRLGRERVNYLDDGTVVACPGKGRHLAGVVRNRS
jgi:serine/threonine protein kinase